MKDNLIYPLADILGLSMHEMRDGKIRGAGSRWLQVAGLKFNAEIVAASDELSDRYASYLVRLYANLWLYVEVSLGDGSNVSTKITSFDGDVVGIKAKDVATFGTGKAVDTLLSLKDAIRGAWSFTPTSKAWVAL